MAKLPQSRFLPRPPGHEEPLRIDMPKFQPASSSEWLSKHGLKGNRIRFFRVFCDLKRGTTSHKLNVLPIDKHFIYKYCMLQLAISICTRSLLPMRTHSKRNLFRLSEKRCSLRCTRQVLFDWCCFFLCQNAKSDLKNIVVLHNRHVALETNCFILFHLFNIFLWFLFNRKR